MKPATMACSALLGLFACLCTVAGAPPVRAETPPPSSPAPRPPAGPAAQTQTPPPPPAVQATGPRQASQARSGERRRRSYASCNRLSQSRGLRGGVRRRFLIRCKLGYERPKPAQAQPPQGRQP